MTRNRVEKLHWRLNSDAWPTESNVCVGSLIDHVTQCKGAKFVCSLAVEMMNTVAFSVKYSHKRNPVMLLVRVRVCVRECVYCWRTKWSFIIRLRPVSIIVSICLTFWSVGSLFVRLFRTHVWTCAWSSRWCACVPFLELRTRLHWQANQY